jgi:hypothetical protein
MTSNRSFFSKKWLIGSLLSLVFTFLILFILPPFIRKFDFYTHITFNYYYNQLLIIIPALPLSFFLFSIVPLRRRLDYSGFLNKFSTKSFLLSVFLISLLITNIVSYLFYDHIPQEDAVVTFYQAKILLSGHLWSIPPAFPEFFLNKMVINNGKWFSMVQYGHSLFLVPFLALRLPFLLSPILGSFALIIFFFFLKNCFDIKTAKEGTLLLLLSPTFLFISSSYVNQNSSAFLILLSLLFISFSVERNNRLFPLLTGLFAGLAFFVRTTVVAFIPPFIVILFLSGKKKKRESILFFLIGFLPAFAIQFIHNFVFTGNAFRFAYALHSVAKLHDIGFGSGKGASTFNIAGHTPLKSIINLVYNTFVTSLHLFGWPLVSLMFIPIALMSKRKNVWVLFSLLVIILVVIFFSLYWFHGVTPMGPKFYYAIVPLLVLLTVRGISRKPHLRPLVALLIIFNIIIYIPSGLTIFNNVWGTNNHCYNEVKKQSIHNALIFTGYLAGNNEYERSINRHNYLSVSFRNEPFIKKGDIIYAKDLGCEKNKLLINEYKDRKPYLFEYIDSGKNWRLLPYPQ